MNTLGKRPDQESSIKAIDAEFTAIKKSSKEKFPLEKAMAISSAMHVFIALLIVLLPLLLFLLGINLSLFEKPKPKVKDIEFVLVNQPEEKPINPRTKYRAEKNTRAGGKHDPRKAVSAPEPVAPKSVARSSGGSRPTVVRHHKQATQAPRATQPVQKRIEEPQAPPRPVPVQTIPRPRLSAPRGFHVPVPSTKAGKTRAGGPVTSGPIGYSAPSGGPSPMMSSGSGEGSRGHGRGRNSSGYSAGGGQAGNPGPGNPNGRPGIDAVKEPDWGPYMRELQRRIKRNWDPPRGNESKRVVVMFKIAKDGRLLSLKTMKSSGNIEADKAAMSAVELTAPFSPLPPEHREGSIDIQFTFDYNVFSVGGRRF